MAKTLAQVQKEIDELQRQADEIRGAEVLWIIERIKVAVDHYGLTASDLGFTTAGVAAGGSAGKLGKSAAKSRKPGAAQVAKYADGNGNTWGGRGKRPHWLRDALAQGKQLSEFLNPATA